MRLVINKRCKNIYTKCMTLLMLGVMGLSLVACGDKEAIQGMEDDKLSVVTTIFPEYDWVREIAGQTEGSVDTSAADSVDVTLLLNNGVDMHSFQPTVADIIKISTCDIFIYVGGESDKWVDDALKEAVNKDMIVIDLLDVLGEAVKEEEVVEGMQEEKEGEEEVSGEDKSEKGAAEIEYDEHVWLSLKNAELLTSKISEVMQKKDQEHASAFKANEEAYNKKLVELDNEYKMAVESAKYDTILFGDRFPFRYLVDDYGLKYYAAFVGCSAETEAGFDTVVFLAEKIDDLGLPAICTIESGDQRIAETIKNNTESKDQEILVMDSLQSVTSSDVEAGESYLGRMQDNLEILRKCIDSK